MSTIPMNVQSMPSTHPSTFTAWMQKHPVVAFFSIAFAGTWLFELPMVLGKDGLGIFPYSVPLALYAVLFLLSSYSGPTLAAFLVTHAVDGKAGMRKLFRRYAQWRVGLPWYLLAIFGLPILYVAAASISLHGVPWTDLRANWLTFFTTYLPALLIFPAFITWGEEPGWRGFALTRLQQRFHPLVSSLIVGFLHALWHLPVFLLVVGPAAIGPFDLAKFTTNIAGVLALTILWVWIFNHAKGSILIAVLLHASLNATQGWITRLIPDYPHGAGTITFAFYFAAALALILITKGRLGYPERSFNRDERDQ